MGPATGSAAGAATTAHVMGFPAAAFGTNCYVITPGAGQECIVVDPGIGVVDALQDLLQRYRLRPAAVVLTHGHIDHVYSVTPVCSTSGIAARIHTADRYRLADPFGTLDGALVSMLEQSFGPRTSWAEPTDVVEITDGDRLDIAGLTLTARHAPGHTEGSTMFLVDHPVAPMPGHPNWGSVQVPRAPSAVLSGDVLFAGGIGRTDLAGGDADAMRATLRGPVLSLEDQRAVLPGHGGTTTIGVERRANPFLRPGFLNGGW